MHNLQSYGLALHTTSPELGLALSNFAGNDRHHTWDLGMSLSTHLHVHLQEFMSPQTWADLRFIAVAKGPGSFTSTRLGMVTTRTLAQELEIPLFAVSTLAALAWSQHQPSDEMIGNGTIAVEMPARRDAMFAGIYQIEMGNPLGLTTLLADAVLPIATWQQTLAAWPTPYRLIQAETGLGESVLGVLDLAHQHWQKGERPLWSEALPFYGQHPVDDR